MSPKIIKMILSAMIACFHKSLTCTILVSYLVSFILLVHSKYQQNMIYTAIKSTCKNEIY